MKRKKILLVDDSNTILMMEKMLLGGKDYELVTAGDGSEGLAKALSERPDLILLDVVMPKLNGFETLKRLRQDPATEAIPVVLVTTRGERDNVDAGYGSGCNAYVTKPIDRVELLSTVKALLGQGGEAAPSGVRA